MAGEINRTQLANSLPLDLPKVGREQQDLLNSLAPRGKPDKAADKQAIGQLVALAKKDPEAAGAVISVALYRLDADRSLELIRALDTRLEGGLAGLPRSALLSINAELNTQAVGRLLGVMPFIGGMVSGAVTSGTIVRLANDLEAHAQQNAGKVDPELLQSVKAAAAALAEQSAPGPIEEVLAAARRREDATRPVVEIAREYWVNRTRATLSQKADAESLATEPAKVLKAIKATEDYQRELLRLANAATAEERAKQFTRVAGEAGTMTQTRVQGLDKPSGLDLHNLKMDQIRNLR